MPREKHPQQLQHDTPWAGGDDYSGKDLRSRRTIRPSMHRRASNLNDEDDFSIIESCRMGNGAARYPNAMVEAVLNGPEQRAPDESHAGRWIYQSRMRFDDGRLY